MQPGSSALGSDLAATAERVIDATGKYVIPGGVDAHTHMELPFGGTFASDTFETGTRAAAWGGTTTIIDFAVQRAGERVYDGLAAWHGKADGNCAIDYGFHQIIGGVDDDSLKAMDELVDEEASRASSSSWPTRASSTATTAQILRAMQKAATNGAMIMMHAENGTAIDVLVAQALARGETRPDLPRAHPPVGDRGGGHAPRDHARRSLTGRPALHRAHVGASRRSPRSPPHATEGPNVFGETCPQYLYLSLEEQLGAPGFEGAKWVCSTPLRSRARATRTSCGGTCARTTCRWSAPTTARSA